MLKHVQVQLRGLLEVLLNRQMRLHLSTQHAVAWPACICSPTQ